MPDFVVRSFNGKTHHAIEFYKPRQGGAEYHAPELERIPITEEVAALPLQTLIDMRAAGVDLKTVVVRTLEPTATLDGRKPMEAMG